MSSPQQHRMFPLFTQTNSKLSPIKNAIIKAEGSGTASLTGGMKGFFESKILKGIKLNNINQVNSIHSSIHQQNSNIRSQENSLRNIVNSSYWNSTQQSIVQNGDLNEGNIQLLSNKGNKNTISFSKQKIIQNDDQYSPERNRLASIRSRSSSNLTSNRSSLLQPSQNKNFVSEVDQVHLAPSFNQFSIPIETLKLIELKKAKKQNELKLLNLPSEQQVQKLLTQHFHRSFINNLVEYMNKDWAKDESSLLEGRKIQMLINIIIAKFGSFTELINDFLTCEFQIDYTSPIETTPNYTLRQTKLLTSILFRESQKTFQQMKKLFEQLISKLPQEGIVEQEFILEELKKNILEIYDPKFTYSSTKMKERFKLYYEVYCTKRNSLETEIKHKLKPQLNFINQTENYFSSYQKELMKLKGQISNLQKEKQHLMDLLKEKTTFKPIEINFQKLAVMKEQAEERIKKDFDENIVEFHNKIHQKDAETIETLKDENKRMKKEVEAKEKEKQYHIGKLEEYLNSIPTKRDASTQIFNIPTSTNTTKVQKTTSSLPVSPHELGIYPNFLSNIITPFTFNQKITSSLISIITIDKILYDYEPIKSKLPLTSFKHYIYEWFIIRTGSKKIAQILLKNFLYSIKKYRNKHKRFGIFNKICGFSPFRGKNLQEDIQHLFYQTNLAWYYLIKLALVYRKKLNSNPTGYHIFPPINCQQIFKLSLRKAYELIEEFLTEEGIPIPENLTQKIDHYAINEISKFKQHDEDWQKQSLQEIHILREMNFDVIAGFVIDYIASERAVVLEGLIRSIHLKQEEQKSPIGYGQFETIYKKYYKEKRYKIEFIYSKICLCNMNDILNAENMIPAILHCIEDESQLRSIFDKDETLKTLVLLEKQSLPVMTKIDKKAPQTISTNPFDHFRQKFYNEFYDFYDVTIMLEEIFKIVKSLVRKRLKKLSRQQSYIENLLDLPKGEVVGEVKPTEIKKQEDKNEDSQGQEEESSQEEEGERLKTDFATLERVTGERTFIEQKLEEWKKIQQRIPRFATKILTIEQIIIHNMRKKEMLDGCEFAWRTLRDILAVISK